jgi:hypothetical protein
MKWEYQLDSLRQKDRELRIYSPRQALPGYLLRWGISLEMTLKRYPNSQYMKKHKKDAPKRVVAHEFNKQIANYRKNDFDKETLTNMRRVLDFCMNDDWFLL